MRKVRQSSPKVVNYVGRDVTVGKGTQLWHFCYVGEGTRIGRKVVIGSLCHIDRDVVIGDNTRVEGCAYIPPSTRIGKNVFIGPAAVFTNDPYPPSKRLVGVRVEDGVVIGAGALIRAGVKIGRNSVVAMGAIVVDDVPPNTVVMGIPARPRYSRRAYDAKKLAWEGRSSISLKEN